MEHSYGTSLDWFFQEWIYGKGYPSYDYSWTYKQAGDNYVIYLQIEQVQDVSGSEEVFTMPLDVQITAFPDLKKDIVHIWNDKRIQTFQLITDIEPAIIDLDPENWVLNKSKDVSGIENQSNSQIYTYYLEQNYPNPFNPSTVIGYQISTNSDIEITIFNMLGEKVFTLITGNQSAGYHTIEWDATNYPSGVYYYQIKAGEFQAVKKMVLLK